MVRNPISSRFTSVTFGSLTVCIGHGNLKCRPGAVEDEVAYVQAAERLGVDHVWSAEGWGRDAVTPIAYLAARTERILLGTGIMQISARVPAMMERNPRATM